MSDPFPIARALGFAVPFAAFVFVIARRALGPGGARELNRLERIAEMDHERDAALAVLRDWLPLLSAAGAGILAFGVVFALSRVPARDFAAELPQLRASFVNGCAKRCIAEGAAQELCEGACTCAFARMLRQHPSDAAFVEWFEGKDRARVEREALAERSACLADAQER